MRADRHFSVAVAVSLSILGFAPLCAAQSFEPQPLSGRPVPLAFPEQASDLPVVTITLEDLKQLDQWTRDFEEWQKWADQWLSRRQVGWWADFADRKKKPDPPAWLSDVCVILAGDPQFTKGCDLLARWGEDIPTARTRLANTAAIQQRENPTKSAWWQHLHLDGLWGTTQSDISAFGLFGMHFTVKVQGRLQVFIAPGILLVSVPGLYGSR